jgi:hypothetical protein
LRPEALLGLSRFSYLRKVLSITSNVFQFIFKLRWSREDPVLAVQRYWVRKAQSTFLLSESISCCLPKQLLVTLHFVGSLTLSISGTQGRQTSLGTAFIMRGLSCTWELITPAICGSLTLSLKLLRRSTCLFLPVCTLDPFTYNWSQIWGSQIRYSLRYWSQFT